jgi:hypothetical protein
MKTVNEVTDQVDEFASVNAHPEDCDGGNPKRTFPQ